MSDTPPALQRLRERLDGAGFTDNYGKGEVLQEFEARVAAHFGKPAAVFAPSGTMVQPIALRQHCHAREGNLVSFHPTCHLELHEHHAYRHLHGLESSLVGDADRLFTITDLESLDPLPQALLIELPQREIGGQLPDWDDLCEQCSWARDNGIALHLDGARLWECAPHYGDLARVADLFDTVYVSFYKGLGGLSGAMLLGPDEFIDESRIWMRRCGGNLWTLTPYVLSAIDGFENNLPRIPSMVEAAGRLATTLREAGGVEVIPADPRTNMFHVHFDGDRDEILRRNDGRLFKGLQPSECGRQWKFEYAVRPHGDPPDPETFRDLVIDIIRP